MSMNILRKKYIKGAGFSQSEKRGVHSIDKGCMRSKNGMRWVGSCRGERKTDKVLEECLVRRM